MSAGEARAERVNGDVVPFKRPEERRAELEAELILFRGLSDTQVLDRIVTWAFVSAHTWPSEELRFDAFARNERSALYDRIHNQFPPDFD